MSRLRSLLPGQSPPDVLPRLTTAGTAKFMAQATGEDPSTILARLDAERRRKLGKRAEANRNPLGTVEFAVRYAVQKLGVATVSEILGLGESVIYKAVNPNLDDRKLPDLGIAKVVALARALRRAGHAEFFSTAIVAQAEAPPEGTAQPTLHHRLTRLMMAAGDVARAVALATDPDSEGGDGVTPAQAAVILDLIAAHAEEVQALQREVLDAAGTKRGAS